MKISIDRDVALTYFCKQICYSNFGLLLVDFDVDEMDIITAWVFDVTDQQRFLLGLLLQPLQYTIIEF